MSAAPSATNNQQPVLYQNKEIESLLESSWISIKDRETAVLEFLTGPGKIRILEKPDFNNKLTKRVQFTVIDINDAQRKEKTLELSKIHVGKIYEELQQGKTVLEISRSGVAKETYSDRSSTKMNKPVIYSGIGVAVAAIIIIIFAFLGNGSFSRVVINQDE